MKMSQLHTLVGVHSETGPNRPHNEDAYSLPAANHKLEQAGALFVVVDGVGGQAAGEQAAQLAAKAVQDSFYERYAASNSLPHALNESIQYANQQVYRETLHLQKRMGCTLVAVVLHDGQFTVAHVGDARVYRAQPDLLQQMTRDHSWIQEQVDNRKMTQAQAETHDFRNLVRRIVGNYPTVQVTISGPHPLQDNDVLLLCSDGLSNTLSQDYIHRMLISPDSAQTIANNLIQQAVLQDARDNVTALVVQVAPPSKDAAIPHIVQTPSPAGVLTQQRSVQLEPSLTLLWGTIVVLLIVIILLSSVVFRA